MVAGYHPGVPVLDGLSLTVGDGVTRLRGTNGTGKSTLVEVVSGHLRPWAGTAEVRGVPAGDPAARRHRRVCRSRDQLFGALTVREHLLLAARTSAADADAAVTRAQRYGMQAWLDVPVDALSTGNRRKAWLQVCTTGAADVVVLDEPFDGLDDDGVAVLLGEVAAWAARGAVLLVCHAAPPALSWDDEVDLTGVGSPR